MPNRVLVADDDHAIRESLAGALGLAGHDVATVVDGIEALTRIRDGFGALVVDVMTPGVDGLAVCRLLRAEGDRGAGRRGGWLVDVPAPSRPLLEPAPQPRPRAGCRRREAERPARGGERGASCGPR